MISVKDALLDELRSRPKGMSALDLVKKVSKKQLVNINLARVDLRRLLDSGKIRLGKSLKLFIVEE